MGYAITFQLCVLAVLSQFDDVSDPKIEREAAPSSSWTQAGKVSVKRGGERYGIDAAMEACGRTMARTMSLSPQAQHLISSTSKSWESHI